MDRRTIRYPDGAVELKCSVNDAVMRLASYEDTGLSPNQIKMAMETLKCFDHVGIKRGNEIVDAELEGRLIVLPCKVGDTVYKVWYAPCRNGETYPDGVNCDGCMDVCDIHKVVTECTVPNVNFIWVNFVMHGNTVYYLTREEAEAALGGDHDA